MTMVSQIRYASQQANRKCKYTYNLFNCFDTKNDKIVLMLICLTFF